MQLIRLLVIRSVDWRLYYTILTNNNSRRYYFACSFSSFFLWLVNVLCDSVIIVDTLKRINDTPNTKLILTGAALLVALVGCSVAIARYSKKCRHTWNKQSNKQTNNNDTILNEIKYIWKHHFYSINSLIALSFNFPPSHRFGNMSNVCVCVLYVHTLTNSRINQ